MYSAPEIKTHINIAIVSSFSLEPIKKGLTKWFNLLGYSYSISFASHSQIFQQLLDPYGLFAQNVSSDQQPALNVILLNLKDWIRTTIEPSIAQDVLKSTARDFIGALKTSTQRHDTPYILCFSPFNYPDLEAFLPSLQETETNVSEAFEAHSKVHIVPSRHILDLCQLPDHAELLLSNSKPDPFPPGYFSALGYMIGLQYAITHRSPYKALVLECDNVLWAGISSDYDISNVYISPTHIQLQRLLQFQKEQGVVLCLSSRNDESSIRHVFENSPNMVLSFDDFSLWCIDKGPKSLHLQALASELTLEFEEMMYVESHPDIHAEVKSSCPTINTLLLPLEDTILTSTYRQLALPNTGFSPLNGSASHSSDDSPLNTAESNMLETNEGSITDIPEDLVQDINEDGIADNSNGSITDTLKNSTTDSPENNTSDAPADEASGPPKISTSPIHLDTPQGSTTNGVAKKGLIHQKEIVITPATDEDYEPLAQLTKGDHEFNTTLMQRDAETIGDLLGREILHSLKADLRDHTGKNNLVGLLLYQTATTSIQVESMIVSPEANSLHPEHHLIRRIAELGIQSQYTFVDIALSKSDHNLCVEEFLEKLEPVEKIHADAGTIYRYLAKDLVHLAPIEKSTQPDTDPSQNSLPALNSNGQTILHEMQVLDTVLASLKRLTNLRDRFSQEYLIYPESTNGHIEELPEESEHPDSNSKSIQTDLQDKVRELQDVTEQIATHHNGLLEGYKAVTHKALEVTLRELDPHILEEELAKSQGFLNLLPPLRSHLVLNKLKENMEHLQMLNLDTYEERVYRPIFIRAYLDATENGEIEGTSPQE